MTDQQLLEYIRGTLSPDEMDRFLDWVEASPDNKERYRLIRNGWDLVVLSHRDVEAASTDRAYDVLKKKLQSMGTMPAYEKRRAWNGRAAIRIAAAILLSVTASWYFFKHRGEASGYHHIEVPVGQRVKLVLADSTTVWLAAGSKLTYPDHFSKEKRRVELDGEAQFHVTQNKQKPFEVKTATHTVHVLGTQFNVYGYDEASRFETTLYSGSVMIHNHGEKHEAVQLQPGQKLSYDKKRNSAGIQGGIHPSEMDERIDGYLIFNKTPFSDMVERLSRYYQKPIQIKDPEIASYECTGKFHYQEKLEKILEVVRTGRPFEYKISEQEVEIFVKRPKE